MFANLDRYFGRYKISPISAGKTNAQLFSIQTENGEQYILKCQENSLQNDYLNYTWLKGKVPVPQVVFYDQVDAYEMLCMTALKGYPLAGYIGEIEPAEVVKRYAQALKLLHSVKIDAYALVQNLSHRLRQAKNNMENDLVEVSDLQPENQHIALEDLYDKLIALQPQSFDLVFTHGDYCLDNLFFEDENFSGFIDLDKGGVADRYQDLALAVRSISDDLGEEFVPIFFQEYGLHSIDHRKIEFFVILDEFF